MTKQEAIAHMKEGKKITHRYFSDDEWMTMEGNMVILEDGVKCTSEMFWSDRNDNSWSDGYALFSDEERIRRTKLLLDQWLVSDYPDNSIMAFLMCVRIASSTERDSVVKSFNAMPICMRWGVYCLFFDQYNIDLDDLYNQELENYGQQTGRNGDRSELQERTLEKAFKTKLEYNW